MSNPVEAALSRAREGKKVVVVYKNMRERDFDFKHAFSLLTAKDRDALNKDRVYVNGFKRQMEFANGGTLEFTVE